MRGTGQPLCSLRRELPPRLCTCCSRALWLLLQLNSLLRVPYVRMHFRPSDQASWVVASRTWLLPLERGFGSVVSEATNASLTRSSPAREAPGARGTHARPDAD